jgi:hypothetical protein
MNNNNNNDIQLGKFFFCDNCGMKVLSADSFIYGELPCDIDSANAGESAVVCHACHVKIEAGTLITNKKENQMTNNNDGRPFPDIHEAIRALQDVAEAVNELEAECYRLRAELKTSNAERDELRQQVETIKNGFEGGCYLCEVVGEMNKKLLAERDEARRELCNRCYGRLNARGAANLRGWDCFPA